MSRRAVITCDADWYGFPCRGALPMPADATREQVRDAGWTRRAGRDLCPAHSRRPDAVPCEKRVTYATDKEARTALNKLMHVRAVQSGGPITSMEQGRHWCEQHQGFHLTSKKHSGR